MSELDQIRFSIFHHAEDNQAKPVAMTWEQFVEGLGPHRFDLTEKKKVPAFSPAEFRSDRPRKLYENVVRVWFGVLDLDMITDAQLLGVCEKLEGLDAVLYTTWTHPEVYQTRGLWKVRVCIRLSRPIEVVEWPGFWLAMTAHFNGLNDPQCKDPSHIYFGAFAPAGTQALCKFVRFEGLPLDVSTIQAQAFVTAPVHATEKIGRDRLERVGTRWKRARDPYRSEMGEVLLKVCKGTPFAEHGERDKVAFQLCMDLARELPHGSAESIAAHFAQSLQVMSGTSLTVQEIQDKLERAQATAASEVLASEMAKIAETKLWIRQAFARLDPTRDYPYTEPELDSMADSCNCTRVELQKRWLIQRGPLFYILGPEGQYSRPYTDKDVGNAVLRDLAPATSAGVELWVDTDRGPVRKNIAALMGEYGTVAADYVLDMREQKASYNAAQKLFIEAPCPIRELTPQWDADVAAWLEILAGPAHHADVLNWLSWAVDLDKTCAALLLTGRKDTGKSLLAYGVARLWTTSGPTKLSSALGDFNDMIASCPLVFADEQLPKDFRGRGRTAEIREFISDRARPFKKKFFPETQILGSVRLIVAANNQDIMAIQEHLSISDIEAISDRFYHVPVQPEAADFLRLVWATTPGGTRRWTDMGDALARHILWLRDHYPRTADGRFLIQPKDPEFYRGLATRSGIRSNVLQWLCSYLKRPQLIDSRQDYGVRVKGGALYARADLILECWSTYVGNVPSPQIGQLAQAIAELSTQRQHLAKPRGGSAHYRKIDPGHLFAWAEQTEFMTRDEIEQVLKTDTEDRLIQTRPLTLN